MSVDLIIKLLTFGASLVREGLDLYNKANATLSETDKAKIEQALRDAQAVTAGIFPVVDDALTQAKNK